MISDIDRMPSVGELIQVSGWNIPSLSDDQPFFENSPVFLDIYVHHPKGIKTTIELNGGKLFLSTSEDGKHFRFFKPISNSSSVRDLYSQVKEIINNRLDYDSVELLYAPDRDNVIKEIPLLKWKENHQFLYDILPCLELKGSAYKPLREKLNKFKRDNPPLTMENLTDLNFKDAIYVFDQWKETKVDSYSLFGLEDRIANLREVLDRVIAKVYYSNKTPVSVHAAYQITNDTAAHAIGLNSSRIPGLSETTQYLFWDSLAKEGYSQVNDGPTKGSKLTGFKKKFAPKGSIRVFQGSLTR